ncbi:MAG: cytochrome c biogenesis CcdA family protein [Thermomicrobiales bacterium]
MPDVSIIAAFVAGILSISSPCVLPLVPLYLAHLAGVSIGDAGPRARGRVLVNAGAYVLGFSVVFIALGVALGAAGSLASTASVVSENRFWLVRLGGALLILLGLHQVGLITLPYLNRERRLSVNSPPTRHLGSSFMIGVTFGAGWSPCVGPILGAILTMAAGQGDINRAAVLLSVYSLGLSVPFLVAAFAFGSSPSIIRRLNGRLQTVTSMSGAVMLAVGMIMVLGIYQQFFAELVRIAPWTPWEPEL